MIRRLNSPAARLILEGLASVGAFLLMVGALALWS